MARSFRTVASTFFIAAATLTAAACGSSGGPTADGPGENPATGDPIKVGYINQEQSASGSFPEYRQAAEAAVQYLNRDDGGINGRPIQLVTCETNGSPEASQSCANTMVREKVAVTLTGLDFGGPASAEILKSAGIPYVTTTPIQATDFSGENVFAFFGSTPGQFSAESEYLGEQGLKSAALITNDTPAGVQGAELLKAALEKGGFEKVTIIPESPTATDFTAVVTAAMNTNPDVISVLFVAPACGQILGMTKSLGFDKTVMTTSGCLDPSVIANPSMGEGALFVQESLNTTIHADDPEVKIYHDSMSRYAGLDADQIGAHGPAGFSAMITLAEFLRGTGTDPTPESVSAALKAPQGVKGFMDSPVVCDQTALPGFPSICNASARIVTFTDGELTEVTTDWIVP